MMKFGMVFEAEVESAKVKVKSLGESLVALEKEAKQLSGARITSADQVAQLDALNRKIVEVKNSLSQEAVVLRQRENEQRRVTETMKNVGVAHDSFNAKVKATSSDVMQMNRVFADSFMFQQSFSAGIMSVGNNFEQVIASVQRMQREAAAMNKPMSGLSAMFEILKGSITSLPGIMSIATTALIVFGDQIAKYGEKALVALGLIDEKARALKKTVEEGIKVEEGGFQIQITKENAADQYMQLVARRLELEKENEFLEKQADELDKRAKAQGIGMSPVAKQLIDKRKVVLEKIDANNREREQLKVVMDENEKARRTYSSQDAAKKVFGNAGISTSKKDADEREEALKIIQDAEADAFAGKEQKEIYQVNQKFNAEKERIKAFKTLDPAKKKDDLMRLETARQVKIEEIKKRYAAERAELARSEKEKYEDMLHNLDAKTEATPEKQEIAEAERRGVESKNDIDKLKTFTAAQKREMKAEIDKLVKQLIDRIEAKYAKERHERERDLEAESIKSNIERGKQDIQALLDSELERIDRAELEAGLQNPYATDRDRELRRRMAQEARLRARMTAANQRIMNDTSFYGENNELSVLGDDAKAATREVQKLSFELEKLTRSPLPKSGFEVTRDNFLQGLPMAFAFAIEAQIQYNSEAARLERERALESIAEERKRIDETRQLKEEEYERGLEDVNYYLETNQISQAEANRRTTKLEKKRANEMEELRKRETEVARREQQLQSESLAASVATNVVNLAVQAGAQLIASSGLNPFVIAAAIAGIGILSTTLKAMIQQPRASFAEGRMFMNETVLGGAVVGDGMRAPGVPVNIEALLNAVQLRDFGEMYSDRKNAAAGGTAVVNITVQTRLDATKLVEEFEEQKQIYAQLKLD